MGVIIVHSGGYYQGVYPVRKPDDKGGNDGHDS
jgi:hypothetical protein